MFMDAAHMDIKGGLAIESLSVPRARAARIEADILWRVAVHTVSLALVP